MSFTPFAKVHFMHPSVIAQQRTEAPPVPPVPPARPMKTDRLPVGRILNQQYEDSMNGNDVVPQASQCNGETSHDEREPFEF